MLLQQNSDVAIWGKSESETKVRISASWSKKMISVYSDENGAWSARIDTPDAGGPFILTIAGEFFQSAIQSIILRLWMFEMHRVQKPI